MKNTYLKVLFLLIIVGSTIMCGCSKPAEKIEDTYIGSLTMNDSLVSSTTEILIKSIDKNLASVNSYAFNTYDVEIDKKRYFAAKTYFSVGINEQLEVTDDGNIILIHNDNNGDKYIFVGTRN
jgi:hypothetical protein